MGLINPSKKYKSLVAFGCSFTDGGSFTKDYSWVKSLSNRLGCEKETVGLSGSSNHTIMSRFLSYCENNDMSDVCVGIQWSQSVRREVWNSTSKNYDCVNVSIFDGDTSSIPWIDFEDKDMFIKNEKFFNSIWWDYYENTLRTIQNMILAKHYLISRNIDFVMFEGIGTIMEELPELDPRKNLPFLKLLNPDVKKNILDHETFFSELGDMYSSMNKHKDFDTNENGGHPTGPICEWWADEMMKYMNKVHGL